ncbi:hypothetical protein ACWGF2_33475 [Streptomyces sp. NPDC054919]
MARLGIDAGKKFASRKRSNVIDSVGLLLSVLVQGERAGLRRRLDPHRADRRRVSTRPQTWVDGGYRQHLVEHAATLGIGMHIVCRDPSTRGFTVHPRRRTVERTLGWLMQHRRLACEYKARSHRSEPVIPRNVQPHDPSPHQRIHTDMARRMNPTYPGNPG